MPLPQYFGVVFETQLGGPAPGTTTGLGAACTVGWDIFFYRALAKGAKVQDLPTDFEGTANQVIGFDTHIFAFADRPIVFGFRFGNPVQKSDRGAVGRHGGDTGSFRKGIERLAANQSWQDDFEGRGMIEEINTRDFTVQSKDNTDLLVNGGKRLDVAVQNVSSLFITVSHRIGVRGRSKVQRHLRDRTPDLGLVCPATAGLSQVGRNRPGFLHPQFGEGDVLGFCEVSPAPVPATALDARDWDRQGASGRHQDGEIQDPVLFGADELLAI